MELEKIVNFNVAKLLKNIEKSINMSRMIFDRFEAKPFSNKENDGVITVLGHDIVAGLYGSKGSYEDLKCWLVENVDIVLPYPNVAFIAAINQFSDRVFVFKRFDNVVYTCPIFDDAHLRDIGYLADVLNVLGSRSDAFQYFSTKEPDSLPDTVYHEVTEERFADFFQEVYNDFISESGRKLVLIYGVMGHAEYRFTVRGKMRIVKIENGLYETYQHKGLICVRFGDYDVPLADIMRSYWLPAFFVKNTDLLRMLLSTETSCLYRLGLILELIKIQK